MMRSLSYLYAVALAGALAGATAGACREGTPMPLRSRSTPPGTAPLLIDAPGDIATINLRDTCGAITDARHAEIGLCPPAVILTIGSSVQFQNGARRSRGGRIPDDSLHWWTLDSTVATVDSRGIVTARGLGETLVKVRANKDPGKGPLLTDSARVTVIGAGVPVDTIPPDTVPADSTPAPPADTLPAPPADTVTPPPIDTVPTPPADTTPTPPVPAGVLPELPRRMVDVRAPQVSRVVPVAAGGDLQAALNAAVPGDAVELACGATWTGNFTLPHKSGWVVLRSACAHGSGRATPTESYATITTPNTTAALTAGNRSTYWRVEGLELTAAPTATTYNTNIIRAHPVSPGSLADYPAHLVFDHVYVHPEDDATGVQRCILLNAIDAAVINSYLAGCHYAGADAQAIVAWDTPGPLLIDNNYLEGSGENVMFGGAGPQTPGLIPEDLTVTRNWMRKPLSWVGSKWTIKNIFEIKAARRVLVEGNVFEGSWAAGQSGPALSLKSNGEGGADNAVMEDVTVRYNVIRDAQKGVILGGVQENYEPHSYTPPINQRVLIQHNVFENVGAANLPNTNAFWIFQFTGDGQDFAIDHNTVASGSTSALLMFDGAATQGFRFTNNLAEFGDYGVKGSGTSAGTPTLDHYAPGYVFEGNLLGKNGLSNPFPSGNTYVKNRAAVGLVGDALPAGSPYAGTATDGTDPGAYVARVRAMTAGVAP